MHPPSEPQPRQRRYRVRRHARLDAETHAKLEELATAFQRKGAAILRYVIQWGTCPQAQRRSLAVARDASGDPRRLSAELACGGHGQPIA